MDSQTTQGEKIQAVIAEDVEVTGQIKSGSSIQIDGKLNGDLSCAGDAVIGKSANIKGNIVVNCTVFSGQITGNISAKDRVELKATARVMGDIKARRLTVEDGVTFIGKSEVSPSGAAGARPAQQPDAAVAADAASADARRGVREDEENAAPIHGVISGKDDGKGKIGSLFGKK